MQNTLIVQNVERGTWRHFRSHADCVPSLLSPAFASAGTLNLIRLSVCPSVPLSVTKTLTLAITFALLQVELWYLACVFFVTRPFRRYHVVTLTVTFDLLQGQICCRVGDHNYLNLLVFYRNAQPFLRYAIVVPYFWLWFSKTYSAWYYITTGRHT